MIRFVLPGSHPLIYEASRHRLNTLCVMGDGECLGDWEPTWSRRLFTPDCGISVGSQNSDEATSLLVAIGKKGSARFQFVVVYDGKRIVAKSALRRVELRTGGIWRLTDSGYSGYFAYELQKEYMWTSPYQLDGAIWTDWDNWQIIENSDPTKLSFAVRGPLHGVERNTKMIVYFHYMNGSADRYHTSIFNDRCFPHWECYDRLSNAVILCPLVPRIVGRDGEDICRGEWLHDARSRRSKKEAQDIFDLIQRVRNHYGVSEENVAGFGNSNGGYAILELLGQFPMLFSKAAVIGAHIYEPARLVASRIPEFVPLVFFHCEDDEMCEVDDIYRVITAMSDQGKMTFYSKKTPRNCKDMVFSQALPH